MSNATIKHVLVTLNVSHPPQTLHLWILKPLSSPIKHFLFTSSSFSQCKVPILYLFKLLAFWTYFLRLLFLFCPLPCWLTVLWVWSFFFKSIHEIPCLTIALVLILDSELYFVNKPHPHGFSNNSCIRYKMISRQVFQNVWLCWTYCWLACMVWIMESRQKSRSWSVFEIG